MAFVVSSGFKATPRRSPVCRAAQKWRAVAAPPAKAQQEAIKSGKVAADVVEAKNRMLTLCGLARLNGVAASNELKERIQESVIELEQRADLSSVKPATDNAYLLNGDWTLIYTSTKQSSSGKVGPIVGHVMQKFELDNKKFFNQCFLGPVLLSLEAKWNVLDDRRFKVLFQNIKIYLFGNQVALKPFRDGASGIWRMGYTDDSVRVIWTKRTENDEKEYVFILRKEERSSLP
eukprot:Plantae.Rhodophyta-Purpureofilum_apyrenoidigerum.ctg15407.p1 GENE.Plantae.Rhodophyta-Purpureofilum_apyrenoidigerum.ctg15407~~Plantae.Rhodophyta-Purpureofilum_apyrenoidigerum.ctg15407.p1  ORF type:complete len:233 (-),score=48.55 Plantae.Rhodophyta-Purpureofilum_apyrenoidigerum.ctg15407:73-771(-)